MMKGFSSKLKGVAISITLLTLPLVFAAHAQEIITKGGASKPQITAVSKSVTNWRELLEGGRVIMRRPEGTLNGVFLEGSKMRYSGSNDNGKTWEAFPSQYYGGELRGQDAYPALDSNNKGTYIAYVKRFENRSVGRVVRIEDPFKDATRFDDHGPLTPEGGQSQYSFVQASRLGKSSVVYGWFDASSGDILVGVSPDGVTFPKAAVIYTDPYALYGPAVAIDGDYVMVSYLTRNPEFIPADPFLLKKNAATVNTVWMESGDAGRTWSQPKPLFGPSLSDFPKINALLREAGGKEIKGLVVVAGSAVEAATFGQVQAWPSPALNDSRIFIMTSLSAVTTPDNPFPATYWDDESNAIGVLSFKVPAVGGSFTHVVTNKELVDVKTNNVTYQGYKGWFHQYGALPKTAVRAVAYLNRAPLGRKDLEDQIAVAISIDTGKTFDHFATFTSTDLGLPPNARIVMRSSQCLYKDERGDVWLDVFLANASKDSGGMMGPLYFAKLPLDVTMSYTAK